MIKGTCLLPPPQLVLCQVVLECGTVPGIVLFFFSSPDMPCSQLTIQDFTAHLLTFTNCNQIGKDFTEVRRMM